MAGGEYWHCEICNQKALYDGSDDNRQDIVVMHVSCMWRDRKERDADLQEKIAREIEIDGGLLCPTCHKPPNSISLGGPNWCANNHMWLRPLGSILTHEAAAIARGAGDQTDV